MYQAFRTQEAVYRRYWARAFAGWARFRAAAPWRRASRVRGLGAPPARSRSSSPRTSTACISAPAAARSSISTAVSTTSSAWAAARARRARRCRTTMAAANPGWHAAASAAAPDGDADIDAAAIERVHGAALRTLRRPAQAGRRVLRRERAAASATRPHARRWPDADALLVAGSSLMVYSGFRFVRAGARGRPADRDRQSRPHARRRPGRTQIEDDVGTVLSSGVVRTSPSLEGSFRSLRLAAAPGACRGRAFPEGAPRARLPSARRCACERSAAPGPVPGSKVLMVQLSP